jgi:hypothetical protein
MNISPMNQLRTTTVLSRLAFAMGIVGLLVISQFACAQVPVGHQHAVLMQKKLTATQEIVAGIAFENFDELAKQAQLLSLLSHEAGWNVIQTPEYIRLSDAFRGSTAQLKRAAEVKNLDAIGLAYIKISISCIDCHRHAKEELAKIGQRPAAEPTPRR